MIDTKQTQRVIVTTHDRRMFVEKIGEMYKLGGVLAPNTVPRLTSPFPFQAEFIFEVDSPEQAIQSSHGVHAMKPDFAVYTKQMMQELSWDDFREACSLHGVKGRDREVMLNSYLIATKQKG